MSKIEIPEEIAALARKVGRQFKSEQDLADFSRLLKKITEEPEEPGQPHLIRFLTPITAVCCS